MTRRRSVPVPLLVLAAAGVGFIGLPLLGLLVRAPWTDLGALLTSEVVREALWLSTVTSVLATLAAALLGVPLALLLARVSFPGKAVVRALVLLPLVLPPVVGGAALLFALGRRGVVGEPLEAATGLVLPFSLAGAVVAAAFVAMPFAVITTEAALRSLDGRHEAAAASLGARPGYTLRRVTIPMIGPSLLAGLALTWARAFGEFGATITFAGNLPGRTQTLPLAVFAALEQDRDSAIAISLLMVAVSLTVLVALRDRWWRAW